MFTTFGCTGQVSNNLFDGGKKDKPTPSDGTDPLPDGVTSKAEELWKAGSREGGRRGGNRGVDGKAPKEGFSEEDLYPVKPPEEPSKEPMPASPSSRDTPEEPIPAGSSGTMKKRRIKPGPKPAKGGRVVDAEFTEKVDEF